MTVLKPQTRTLSHDDRFASAGRVPTAPDGASPRVDAVRVTLTDPNPAATLRTAMAKLFAAATPRGVPDRTSKDLREEQEPPGRALSDVMEERAALVERETERRVAAEAGVAATLKAQIAERAAAGWGEIAADHARREARIRAVAAEIRSDAALRADARGLQRQPGNTVLTASAVTRLSGGDLRVPSRLGAVRGPGGPWDDRVLARLSPGEFVVNADAAARHRIVLEAINRGERRPVGYADGGIVAANTDGNALRRNDEVPVSSTPMGRATSAWAQSHGVPSAVAAASAPAEAIGASLLSGHSADDLLAYEKPRLPSDFKAKLAVAVAVEPFVLGARMVDAFTHALRWSDAFQRGAFRDPDTGREDWNRAVPGAVNAASLFVGPGLGGTFGRVGIKAVTAEEAGALTAGRSQGIGESATLASRNPVIYDPPERAPRPLSSDYKPKSFPDGPPIDDAGRITHDPEGRELFAAHIAGRTSRTGPDQAISPAQLNAVSEGGIGQSPQAVAGSKVPGGGVGAFVTEKGPDGPERFIYYDRSLAPTLQNRVIAHEIGHMIDELSFGIEAESPAMQEELRRNYNTLNNPERATKPGTGRYGPQTGEAAKGKFFAPQDAGYRSGDVTREYMVEAIRAYMANPNYFKTVAPKTAAAIRAAVNSNPRLNRVIQFNAGGLPVYLMPKGGSVSDDSAPHSRPSFTAADVLRLDAGRRATPNLSDMSNLSPYGVLRRTPPPSSFFGLSGPALDAAPSIGALGFAASPYADESGRGFAAQQRAAERAVLPSNPAAAPPPFAPEHHALSGSVDVDLSGVHEAIHHVRTLKAELASFGTAIVEVRHRGFGARGDHAPGAVRTALNGNFGSDGRAFG